MTKANSVAAILILALVSFQAAVSLGLISFDTSVAFIPISDVPDDPSVRAQQLENLATVVDSAASSLLTIHIGLFVLVGFSLSIGYRAEDGLNTVTAALLAAFVFFSFATLYVGYLARFQVIERTNASYLDFSAVEKTVAMQGFLLGISAILAIATSAFHLMQPRPHLPAHENHTTATSTQPATAEHKQAETRRGSKPTLEEQP